MLRPRIIPCLLMKDKGLVKTIQFKKPKYVGDPINTVRIFNEKEVDELIIMDIDATTIASGPDYKMIEHLAAECRMPLCYGGGVTRLDQVKTIIRLGVEKVAISAAAVENPGIISKIAEEVGRQSVVVVLDVKKRPCDDQYEVWTHNGKKNTGKCPIKLVKEMEKLGVGEIVINAIDHDGEMQGYDLVLSKKIREAITVPMTVLGGAGSLKDIGNLIGTFGIVGASAGSLFVFKGIYKAVLINYPCPTEKEALICANYPQFMR